MRIKKYIERISDERPQETVLSFIKVYKDCRLFSRRASDAGGNRDPSGAHMQSINQYAGIPPQQ